MAYALEIDPIYQLQENLQCSVCLEPLRDPRTLPCFHSFCKVCLEGVVATCRGKAPRGRPIRQFHCPNCRETFTLEPNKKVADMPRNHFICNMVEATAVLNRGIGVPCSHNCNKSSVARCVTCEKFICQQCLTAHNNYRGHDNHSVLTMEELSKPENRKKIRGKMYCNEHSGKTLKVYCETCDKLICKDCMDFKHTKPNHSCFLVKDVASNYKEKLASKNKAMDSALNEGNAHLRKLSAATKELERDVENAKSKILQRKDTVMRRLAEMVEQKAATILNEVDQIHGGQRAKLDGQTEETKVYSEQISRSVQLSRKLVDSGTEEEIISSQKMMLDHANNLLTKRPAYPKAPVRVAKFSYTPCTDKEPLNEEIATILANCMGEVNTENKDTGPKSEAAANTKQSDDEKCSICLCLFTNKKILDKCGHSFCTECIDKAFQVKKQCPTCYQAYGPLTGDQPEGKMFAEVKRVIFGRGGYIDILVITYEFPDEIPKPFNYHCKLYKGTSVIAYLPNNEEGKKVLRLLRKAFDQKLTFTIGRSSPGIKDVVKLTDIPHKTSWVRCLDPGYLKKVQEVLTAKGITE